MISVANINSPLLNMQQCSPLATESVQLSELNANAFYV